MGMSVGVTYSTRLGEYRIYPEKRVQELIDQLLRADLVVGFNVINFDYEVLMGYTVQDLPHLCRTLDLLVEIEKTLGHRLGLDAVASASLGVGKTGDGLDAIRWWREGKLLEIAEYCCFDVKCTKLVHEFGVDEPASSTTPTASSSAKACRWRGEVRAPFWLTSRRANTTSSPCVAPHPGPSPTSSTSSISSARMRAAMTRRSGRGIGRSSSRDIAPTTRPGDRR